MTIRDVLRQPIIVTSPADAVPAADLWLLQTTVRRIPPETRDLFERAVLVPWVDFDGAGRVHLHPATRRGLERLRQRLIAGEDGQRAIARDWLM